jgi:hypothetical protein
MSLSIKELKEKISQVQQDLRKLAEDGGTIQAISTLRSYKEYLEDELKILEQNERSNR